jgi:hypothetical protein
MRMHLFGGSRTDPQSRRSSEQNVSAFCSGEGGQAQWRYEQPVPSLREGPRRLLGVPVRTLVNRERGGG